MRYAEGESMMLLLDEEDICIATRSACASGSLRASHVLLSVSRDYAAAQGTLLFSFGMENNVKEVERALETLKKVVAKRGNISPLIGSRRGIEGCILVIMGDKNFSLGFA